MLKVELPYDLAIPVLGIYLKECKSALNRDTYTPMCICDIIHNSQVMEIRLGTHQHRNEQRKYSIYEQLSIIQTQRRMK
jgi:hypothetical protein